MGKVMKHLKSEEGQPIGKYNDNPLLDTRKYERQLPDRATAAYHANVIAEPVLTSGL